MSIISKIFSAVGTGRSDTESKRFEENLTRDCSALGKKAVEQFPLLTDNDHLTRAALAGHAANQAVREKKYDAAWRLLHNQKSEYLSHASSAGFDERATLALDGSVHEKMANILRLEGRHHEALVDIVYWNITGNDKPTKRHDQKFATYFGRCKLENTTLDSARDDVRSQKGPPDFLAARNLVSEWIASG